MTDRLLKLHSDAPTTNKDIKRTTLYVPLDLRKKILESADRNRRSFNSELLCLAESGLECQKA
jgi:hypothetical protein